MKYLINIIILLFSSLTLAQVYSVNSVFTTELNEKKLIQGHGFILETFKNSYFISAYHVLGGENNYFSTQGQLVYASSTDDLIIYKINESKFKNYKPLLKMEMTCNCLRLNKPQDNLFKFYITEQNYILTLSEFKTNQNLIISDYQKKNNFNNFSDSLNFNHVSFPSKAFQGFSGAPVISYETQFLGLFIRYNETINKATLVSSNFIYNIINNFEFNSQTLLDHDMPLTDAIINKTHPFIAKNNYKIKSGGDLADGGQGTNIVENNFENEISGLDYNGRKISYIKFGSHLIYPNSAAIDYFNNLNIKINSNLVFDEDTNSRLDYIFYGNTEHQATSYQSIPDNDNNKIIFTESKIKLDKEILNLELNIQKPFVCHQKIQFNKLGYPVSDQITAFSPILKTKICNEPVLLDLRSFFFLNLDISSNYQFILSKRFIPKLKIKIQNEIHSLDFY